MDEILTIIVKLAGALVGVFAVWLLNSATGYLKGKLSAAVMVPTPPLDPRPRPNFLRTSQLRAGPRTTIQTHCLNRWDCSLSQPHRDTEGWGMERPLPTGLAARPKHRADGTQECPLSSHRNDRPRAERGTCGAGPA